MVRRGGPRHHYESYDAMTKPSVLLVSGKCESHKQEKQAMRDSYRQFVNRWKSTAKKALKASRVGAVKAEGRSGRVKNTSVMVVSPTGKKRMEKRA